jgi:tetratricopeptide (TPR) repeat protein
MKVLDINPNNIEALVLIGKAYASIDNHQLAIQTFQNAIGICKNQNNFFMYEIVLEKIEAISNGKTLEKTHENTSSNTSQKSEGPPVLNEVVNVDNENNNNNYNKKKIQLENLKSLHAKCIGMGPNQINPTFLSQVRNNLTNATGISLLDDLIAFGYLQINTNKLDIACDLFQQLLEYKQVKVFDLFFNFNFFFQFFFLYRISTKIY